MAKIETINKVMHVRTWDDGHRDVTIYKDDYRKHSSLIDWQEICRLIGAEVTDGRIAKLSKTAEEYLGRGSTKTSDLLRYSLNPDGTVKQYNDVLSSGSDRRDESFSDSTYWDEEI